MPRQLIDYAAAAEQLLAVLSAVAYRMIRVDADEPDEALYSVYRPILAAPLSRLVFPEHYRHWDHESRRRRIREAVKLARHRLTLDQASAQICANGSGYWIATDPATLARYAALRRRHGLAALASASHLKPNIAAASGQLPIPYGDRNSPENCAGSQPPSSETQAQRMVRLTQETQALITKYSPTPTPSSLAASTPASPLDNPTTPIPPISPSAADLPLPPTPVSEPREGI